MKKFEEWKNDLFVDGKVKEEYDNSIIVNLEELDIFLLKYLKKEIDEEELKREIDFVLYRFRRIRKSK